MAKYLKEYFKQYPQAKTLYGVKVGDSINAFLTKQAALEYKRKIGEGELIEEQAHEAKEVTKTAKSKKANKPKEPADGKSESDEDGEGNEGKEGEED